MKLLVLFLAISLSTSALIAANAPPANGPAIAVFSFEDNSCGAWTKSANNTLARAQYSYWFRGFVSGYNFGRPDNQVALSRLPDPDTVALFVDKYCRENPLLPFTSAAFELVRQLRDHSDPEDAKPSTSNH